MKWLILILSILLSQMTVYANEPDGLYAQSAVLMDAESGRVLFEKNGYEQKAMASTTKIMTCILALENGNPDDIVIFSDNAASQPKVHLGASSGSKFYLKDLLYSLMLESHNDSAVAIAEHIGGNVENFAMMMNQKAKELGCGKTHYVTPNGLDESNEEGNHVTTAEELAKVMSYCIGQSKKADEFLEITQTQSKTFTELDSGGSYFCTNRNLFLNMMEGALSGKTGYTSKAGYCYVGALERDDRRFVVALLGCGWPNHKDYKWSDTRELMEYALENYEYRNVYEELDVTKVSVENGVPDENTFYGESYMKIEVNPGGQKELNVLMSEEEKIEIKTDLSDELRAPIERDEVIGTVSYYLEDELLRQYPIIAAEAVKEKNIKWYFVNIVEAYIKKA